MSLKTISLFIILALTAGCATQTAPVVVTPKPVTQTAPLVTPKPKIDESSANVEVPAEPVTPVVDNSKVLAIEAYFPTESAEQLSTINVDFSKTMP